MNLTEKVYKLYYQGYMIHEIARECGISEWKVIQILHLD